MQRGIIGEKADGKRAALSGNTAIAGLLTYPKTRQREQIQNTYQKAGISAGLPQGNGVFAGIEKAAVHRNIYGGPAQIYILKEFFFVTVCRLSVDRNFNAADIALPVEKTGGQLDIKPPAKIVRFQSYDAHSRCFLNIDAGPGFPDAVSEAGDIAVEAGRSHIVKESVSAGKNTFVQVKVFIQRKYLVKLFHEKRLLLDNGVILRKNLPTKRCKANELREVF